MILFLQPIVNGNTCSLDILEVNPNLHLGDWTCEIWNGIKKFNGGMPEDKATIRVIELGVRGPKGPFNQQRNMEVDAGKWTIISGKDFTLNQNIIFCENIDVYLPFIFVQMCMV